MVDFHFIRPWWLVALLPLALFYWRLLVLQKTQSGWHQWLPQHLAHVLVNSAGKQSSWSAHRLALFWLISTTALAGPTWERLPQPVYQLETGQVVIMDMSPSLLAEDIEPNRLTQLRFKAMDLVKSGLDGDTGLIAYADDAFTISPLTADNNNLLNLIPSLSPQIMPKAGSEPLRALKLADELLTNAGYAEGDIYWLTDGIASSELNALSSYLRNQPHRVSILGVGTEEGAPIRSDDGSLLKDRFNQTIIAKLTPSRLQDLAQLTGGIYQTVQRDTGDVAALVNQPPLTREGKDGDQQQQGDQWRDNGPFLALLLIPLVLFSWRRGGSLGSWLLFSCLMPLAVTSPSVHATLQSAETEASDWWLNKEQQAQQLLQNKQYEAAAGLSEQPLRRGVAHYRNENYQAAVDSFAELDTAEGWYNRGNALAQLQQYEAAKESYQEALKKRESWQQAEENKALMDELLQQQQAQQDGDQQGQQGEEGEQNERRDQQGQNDSQGQEQAQQEEKDGDSESQQPDPSGQQQGDAEPQEQRQQQSAQEDKKPQPEQQPSSESEQQRSQQTQFRDDIDPEKAQQLEQWMKRIPDDPSILLRNKMLLESQRRNQRRASQPEGVERKW